MSKGHHAGLKLSQLRALVTIADCGNFGEAALQLGLTQPTVSHEIATLEEALGVILFLRGRHGAQLTPAGEAITTHARDILTLLNTVQQTANLHKGLEGGQVRIATFRSAAAHLLPKIVARFQADYAAVDFTVTELYDYTDVEQQLRAGKADIGITLLPTTDEFETWELMHDPFWVLIPETMQAIPEQLTWQQLIAMPLISYPDDNSGFTQVKQHFQQSGHDLKPRYQFRETHTILNMVAQGVGVAIVPSLSLNPLPPGVTVRQLPSPLERVISAIVLAGALQTPAVFSFLRILEQHKPMRNNIPGIFSVDR